MTTDTTTAPDTTDPQPAPAEIPDGDLKVIVEWTIKVVEYWRTTVTVADLVEQINLSRDKYDDLVADVTNADIVAALADDTFDSQFGRILARDGGALPNWEDSQAEGTDVYAEVTERDLDRVGPADQPPAEPGIWPQPAS